MEDAIPVAAVLHEWLNTGGRTTAPSTTFSIQHLPYRTSSGRGLAGTCLGSMVHSP